MQYPFPDEFAEESRRVVLAEEIRAGRDLEDAKKKGGVFRLPDLLIGFILRVFIVFVREASKLTHQGIWSAGRLQEESLQFLRDRTVCARHERGYDKDGNLVSEMVSNWGSILPNVERAFRKSPLWKEYEDILLEVAVAPVGRTAELVGKRVWEDIEISFIGDERVQVKVGTQRQTLNYAEMGFEDERSGKPNQAWGMLRALARAGGVLPDSARNSKEFIGMEKGFQRMRKQLKTHFQIVSDPLVKDPVNGDRWRFKIGCAPSFEK